MHQALRLRCWPGCNMSSAGRWTHCQTPSSSDAGAGPRFCKRDWEASPSWAASPLRAEEVQGSQAHSPSHSRGHRLLDAHLLKALSQKSSQTLLSFPSGHPARVAWGRRKGQSGGGLGRARLDSGAELCWLCWQQSLTQGPHTRRENQVWEKGGLGPALPRTRNDPGHLPWRPDSQ